MTLRETVRNLMVARHRISIEIADYHVSEMDDAEVRRRFRFYSRTARTEFEAGGPVGKVSGPVFREDERWRLETSPRRHGEPGRKPFGFRPMPEVESFPGCGAEPHRLRAPPKLEERDATFRAV
jgi:hypothetical protein